MKGKEKKQQKEEKKGDFDPDGIYENIDESEDSFEHEKAIFIKKGEDPFVEFAKHIDFKKGDKHINDVLSKAVIIEREELIDVKEKSKHKYPLLVKIKVITDLLNRDDIEEDKSRKLEKDLLVYVNKVIESEPRIRKRFGFKYYENVKKYSSLDDILHELIN